MTLVAGRIVLRCNDLVERACYATGLDDFGSDSYKEGLEQLIYSVNNENFEDGVRGRIEQQSIRRLSNRLRVEAWYRTGLVTAPVAGPVVIVGLPRSGTSALLSLLSLDGRFRFLRSWEAREPCPPPILAAEPHDRRKMAADRYGPLAPESALSPYIAPNQNAPDEDRELMGLDFRTPHLDYPLVRFRSWWRGSDPTPALAYHERVLKLLHYARPPSWWLVKSPIHLYYLSHLVEQYPSARVIMTHRDPILAMSSACELTEALYTVRGVHVNEIAIGGEVLGFWSEAARRAAHARVSLDSKCILDVDSTEILERPLALLSRIEAFLGCKFSKELRDKALDVARRYRPRHRDAPESILTRYGLRPMDVLQEFLVELWGVLCPRRSAEVEHVSSKVPFPVTLLL